MNNVLSTSGIFLSVFGELIRIYFGRILTGLDNNFISYPNLNKKKKILYLLNVSDTTHIKKVLQFVRSQRIYFSFYPEEGP